MYIYKTSAVIIVLLLAIVSLQAANPNADKADEMVRKTVERLTEIIGLEPSQQILLTEMVKNQADKIQVIQKLQDRHIMVTEIKKNAESFNASLDSILTPDQRIKLAAKKEAIKTAIAEKNKDKKVKQ